jgi:hypothetical protein
MKLLAVLSQVGACKCLLHGIMPFGFLGGHVRYTSIGKLHDTLPNPALFASKDKFKPAYLMLDERLERAGRVKVISLEEREREGFKDKVELDRVWCSAGVSCLLESKD